MSNISFKKAVDEDISQLNKSEDECKETDSSTLHSNDDDKIDLIVTY